MRLSCALSAAFALLAPPLWAQSDPLQPPAPAPKSVPAPVPAPAPSPALAWRVGIVSGVDYEERRLTSGETIERLALPLGLRVARGRVSLTAEAPYMRVAAPANVVVPGGPLGLPILTAPGGSSEVRLRDGFGDLRLGAAYKVPVAGVSATLRSGVKVPTASASKGLGTGKADVHVGADLAGDLGGITPFASLSFTLVGDPDGVDLRNTLAGQAGAAVRLGASGSAHLGVSSAQGASAGVGTDQRIFGGYTTRLGEGLRLGAYASAGTADAAAVSGGVSVAWELK